MRRLVVTVLVPALAVFACSGNGDAPGSASDAGADSTGSATGDAGGDDQAAADGAPSDATPDAPLVCGGHAQPCCPSFQCQSGLVCTGSTCAPAVASASCPTGATAAVFISEQSPPSSLQPWQEVLATVTFANCSGSTWKAVSATAPSGYKLGGEAPQDNDTWGSSRVALPADVPSGSQVTVAIDVHAPPLTGDFGYAWGIVDEGVGWLAAPSPSHTISVQATPMMATICPGVQADIGGGASASMQIQQCIDATPSGGTLELPAGIYRITSEIDLDSPITLRTVGTAGNTVGCLDPSPPRCAVLRADDNLNVPRGFVRPGTTSGVLLDHIVLDGNRAQRLSSAAAATCASGSNGAGFNASTPGCTGCSFLQSASVRALCGTGFEWRGDQATIDGSVFQGNGDHATTNMWSDGLTLLQSNGAVVKSSRFVDNSDVDLIFGGGQNATIQNNTIGQVHQASFAGLMLDNFNGGTPGDFTGTTVSGNSVDCGPSLCDFAIELGPHPWYLSANILGGTVTQNTASGGKFDIDCEGAGTASAPTVVTQNTFGPVQAQATFNCGTMPTTAFNVSPDSVVDVGSGPAATGSLTHHVCP